MRNTLLSLRIAAAALAGLLLSAAAQAAGDTANLQVSARVPRFLRMQVVSTPLTVAVREEDVARGYVEVEMPLRVALESNAPDAAAISFARSGTAFPLAQVRGLGQDVRIASEGSIRWQPSARRQLLEFRFRLALAPGAAPGEYPWPIQVSLSGA